MFCLVSIKHHIFGKRLYPSVKINYTVSSNILPYCVIKEVIYIDAPKMCIDTSLIVTYVYIVRIYCPLGIITYSCRYHLLTL